MTAGRRELHQKSEDREELERHRDHDARPYVRERSAALLKIAGGMSPHAVAQGGLLRVRDPNTVYGWPNTYQAAGLPGWSSGGMGVLAGGAFDGADREAVKAEVVARLRRGPCDEARRAVITTLDGPPPNRWSLRAIRATFPRWQGLTLSGVWRALHRLDLALARPGCSSSAPIPSTC